MLDNYNNILFYTYHNLCYLVYIKWQIYIASEVEFLVSFGAMSATASNGVRIDIFPFLHNGLVGVNPHVICILLGVTVIGAHHSVTSITCIVMSCS